MGWCFLEKGFLLQEMSFVLYLLLNIKPYSVHITASKWTLSMSASALVEHSISIKQFYRNSISKLTSDDFTHFPSLFPVFFCSSPTYCTSLIVSFSICSLRFASKVTFETPPAPAPRSLWLKEVKTAIKRRAHAPPSLQILWLIVSALFPVIEFSATRAFIKRKT